MEIFKAGNKMKNNEETVEGRNKFSASSLARLFNVGVIFYPSQRWMNHSSEKRSVAELISQCKSSK